jgi:hypothetical protein
LATRSDAPQAHPLAYASLPTSMPLSFAEQEYWINELTQLRSRPPVKPPSEAPPKPRSEGLAAWRIT